MLVSKFKLPRRSLHSIQLYSSSRDLVGVDSDDNPTYSDVRSSSRHTSKAEENLRDGSDGGNQLQSQSDESKSISMNDHGNGSDSSNDYDNGNHSDYQNQNVQISFETKNQTKTFDIKRGETLRTALLKSGISPHNGQSRLINCRGLGTCGTCAVEVVSNNSYDTNNSDGNINGGDVMAIQPAERTTMENIRLNFPPHGSSEQSSNLRLACQIQIYDDVRVSKKSGIWGQSSEKGNLAEEYGAKLYFGDLEYILDNKSPSETKR